MYRCEDVSCTPSVTSFILAFLGYCKSKIPKKIMNCINIGQVWRHWYCLSCIGRSSHVSAEFGLYWPSLACIGRVGLHWSNFSKTSPVHDVDCFCHISIVLLLFDLQFPAGTWRRNDIVLTSLRPQCDVILMLCACCEAMPTLRCPLSLSTIYVHKQQWPFRSSEKQCTCAVSNINWTSKETPAIYTPELFEGIRFILLFRHKDEHFSASIFK